MTFRFLAARRWPILMAVCACAALGLRPAAADADMQSDPPSPASPPEAHVASIALRRGKRTIPAGGHDVMPPSPATGDRTRIFVYTLANPGAAPVVLESLDTLKAANCAVACAGFPRGATLAPGASVAFTLTLTPHDSGPWRVRLSLVYRDDARRTHPWSIAAAGP